MANHCGEKGLRVEMPNHAKVGPPSLLPPPPGPCLWLVSADCHGSKQQTFYGNILGPSAAKIYCKSIRALEDKKVLCCSYGWLVLYDENNKLLSFCNSTNFGDTVVLPRLRQVSAHGVSSCVLIPNKNTTSFNQLNNFKILIFLKEFPAIMCGRIGTNGWIEHRYWKHMNRYFRNWRISEDGYLIFRRAVVCGGKIFAQLGATCLQNCTFWSIEIVKGNKIHFSKINEPQGDPSQSSRPDAILKSRKTYVVESSGELFFVYFWSANLVFDVYRVNLENMEWEKIRYLEDRAFFIGKEYCLSCPVSVSGFGSGRIFFTTKDGNLYSFHMKDQSVSVSPLSRTPWLHRPIWIMPRLLLRPEDNNHNNIDNQRRNCSTTISSVLELDENRVAVDENRIAVLELDENRVERRQFWDLPFEVLEHIASKHLIAKDYMSFRSTSAVCRSVAPLVNWRRTLSTSPESASYVFPCPLLMFADQDESIYKFVDPSIYSIDYNHYLMKIPNCFLDHKIIRYSRDGWILLSERHSDIYLYNPFTRDIMIYSSKVPSFQETIFFFPKSSSMGIDDDARSFCHVIGLGFLPGEQLVTLSTIDDPRAEQWTIYLRDHNCNFEVVTQISPILFEDAVYYLDQEGKLGKLRIDFETRDWSWEVLDKPGKPTFNNCIDFSNFHRNFLVECDGVLISVFLDSLGKWIAVYKLNVDRDWERVTNLGSYDLYLSSTSCLSVPSNGGGNRIYFSVLRDSEIVYFSLDTGKWHFSGSQDSAPDIRGTRWLVNSCWIKPTWY